MFFDLEIKKISKVKTDKYFIKIYPKTVLLDSLNNIEYRLKLIKSVVQYYFEYEWKDSNLILKSQIFNGNHQKLNKNQLIELAKYLDHIHFLYKNFQEEMIFLHTALFSENHLYHSLHQDLPPFAVHINL